MIKSVELKNVIRELVKTNFASLDAESMKVILNAIYGKPTHGGIFSSTYEYDYDHVVRNIIFNGFVLKGSDPKFTVDEIDYGKMTSKQYIYKSIPFASYLIKKYEKSKKLKIPKTSVFNLSPMDFRPHLDSVEETVNDFIKWAKQTHQFMSSNCTNEQFENFLAKLYSSSVLGEVYVDAVIEWNRGRQDAIIHKNIPSSEVFYSVLKRILNKKEWDDEEEINRWKKAIY